jgi:hypothetical protein
MHTGPRGNEHTHAFGRPKADDLPILNCHAPMVIHIYKFLSKLKVVVELIH